MNKQQPLTGRARSAKLLRDTKCTRCKCAQPTVTMSVRRERDGALIVICGDCRKRR